MLTVTRKRRIKPPVYVQLVEASSHLAGHTQQEYAGSTARRVDKQSPRVLDTRPLEKTITEPEEDKETPPGTGSVFCLRGQGQPD